MKCWKAGDNLPDLTEISFKPSKCLTNVSIEDLPKEVFGANQRTVCRLEKCCAFIDFAGPDFSVFQVTVSDNHSLNLSGVKALLLATGYLEYDHRGKLSITKKKVRKKINFYWTVPYSIKDKWINMKMKKNCGKSITYDKNNKDIQDYDIVNACFQKYVDTFVLLIENEPVHLK
jgi:hypothetical protein